MAEKKILIADDEQNLRLLVRASLGKEYIVLEALNGEQAIELARSERPSLILMDVMMPRVNGFEACRILKADPSTGHIPIVMLTASGGEEEKRQSDEVEADGYIMKPFRPQELLDKVKGFVQ